MYCLEVDGTHNFFADGVLVSNCQRLKNPRAACTRAFRKLVKDVPHVGLLTGTPLENKPGDLFSLVNILRPDVFPTEFDFLSEYTYTCRRYGRWVHQGARNLDKLHDLLVRTCMIRRRKADVLDQLPAIRHTLVPLEIDLKEYREAESDYLGWLSKQSPTKADKAANAEELTRLTGLLGLVGRLKVPAVVDWTRDFLESGSKLLLGAIHHDVTGPLLDEFGRSTALVDGTMSHHAKQSQFDRFNTDPDCPLMVANLQAGGTGWSCRSASDVAVCEYPWVPAWLTQFAGRIHGIERGLPGTGAQVFYLFAAGTLEEDMVDLLRRKLDWSDVAIDGEAGATDWSVRDQMKELLRQKAGKGVARGG